MYQGSLALLQELLDGSGAPGCHFQQKSAEFHAIAARISRAGAMPLSEGFLGVFLAWRRHIILRRAEAHQVNLREAACNHVLQRSVSQLSQVPLLCISFIMGRSL
jgi:hypothetical protein